MGVRMETTANLEFAKSAPCLTKELWLCCNSCATMRSERMWLDHQRSKGFLKKFKTGGFLNRIKRSALITKMKRKSNLAIIFSHVLLHHILHNYSTLKSHLALGNPERKVLFCADSLNDGNDGHSNQQGFMTEDAPIALAAAKTPPCCNVRSSLAMQSSVPVKRLGIGRWPGKF